MNVQVCNTLHTCTDDRKDKQDMDEQQRTKYEGMEKFEIAREQGREWHEGKPAIIELAYYSWLQSERAYHNSVVAAMADHSSHKVDPVVKIANEEANRTQAIWVALNRAWRERGEIQTE